MEYVVDFQGFDKFMFKEVAILSLDSSHLELYLFKPPFSFQKLSFKEKLNVKYLEKHYHGLSWSGGHKPLSEMVNMFQHLNQNSIVYVKGNVKADYLRNFFLNNQIYVKEVKDLAEMSCPSLKSLKEDNFIKFYQYCFFNHNGLNNCAYINVLVLAQWLKNKHVESLYSLEVDRAIKDTYEKGYKSLNNHQAQFLPKHFLINHSEDMDSIFDKLPESLKKEKLIVENLRCQEHFTWRGTNGCDDFDGPNPLRKHCFSCRTESNYYLNK